MAPKGGPTAPAGADTRTYRAAYGQPKIGCNEKTSPKTLSGMLGEIFLNLNVEYFNLHMLRHGVPCSPNSKMRSIGTSRKRYNTVRKCRMSSAFTTHET